MSFTAEEYSFLGAVQAETKEEALEAVTEAMPLYQNEEERCFFRERKRRGNFEHPYCLRSPAAGFRCTV